MVNDWVSEVLSEQSIAFLRAARVFPQLADPKAYPPELKLSRFSISNVSGKRTEQELSISSEKYF